MAAQPNPPIYLLQPLPEETSALRYWGALWRRRGWLSAWLMLGLAAGLAWSQVRVPRFAAQAVIRPVAPASMLSQLSPGSGLLDLAMQGQGEAQAYRFISMLQARQFRLRLIARYPQLRTAQLYGARGPAPALSPWQALRALDAATQIDYDRRVGNIELRLTLRRAAAAQSLLAAMIDDLRAGLRARVLQDSQASVESLESQIAQTPDPLLRQQLYQQVAFDLRRAATAKVQADFAFEVIDPPSVDPRPVGAGPLKCAAAGLLLAAFSGACACWWRDYLIDQAASGRRVRG
jgi:uncharacterized protein involved in exopolysaccharide biosynthesis